MNQSNLQVKEKSREVFILLSMALGFMGGIAFHSLYLATIKDLFGK